MIDFEDAQAEESQPGGVTERKKPNPVSTISSEKKSDDFLRMNLKVPPFSPDDPEIWFALLEGQFNNYGITDDFAKFNSVITNLDLHHAKAVKDIIVKPPNENRYGKIKSELIKRLTASHEKKVKQLLTYEELGDRTASQFLRHLQDLAGPNVPQEFIRTIWTNRLPKHIQTVLTTQPTHSLEQLAELADRIQEITGSGTNVAAASTPTAGTSTPASEIAELRKMVERLEAKLDQQTRMSRSNNRSRSQQRRSSSRSQSRSASSYKRHPVCWYHWKFGSQAHKCQPPCDYKAGNDKGGL
ncbi:hypothetical protein ABMA28_013200 [Loxostege sticticalis]|uniref:DUF7041 domain-containing protein n=1 Tax=Loxostege sticticalis TaxID=481309 RepID=A0ABD0THH3_LOXSC